YSRISRSARFHDCLDFPAGNSSRNIDDFFDGEALSVAQVVYSTFRSAAQTVHCKNMRIRQIADVNIVADACAVQRIIIITEYGYMRALAKRRFQNNRNQMRLRIVILADLSVLMR